jgi:hypothetical protein
MAFGRVCQHAEYSYGVWESLAHQASIILRTFFSDPKSRRENICLQNSDLGPTFFYHPERRLGWGQKGVRHIG